ncbi:formimidoylglutamase [Shivajiella indica]|uniref:Formimidoylglutamase n=1 Tax=Shivajiella indica TaxID=872115 RepID=A0ABW5BC06_9BACT
MAQHNPSSPTIWTGRHSDTKEYWYQMVKCLPDQNIPNLKNSRTVVILGYVGDEGVKRNQGRIGSNKGPEAIRKVMGPMAYHLSETVKIFDLGNVFTQNHDMESSHEMIKDMLSKIIKNRAFPIVLGGGHDLAYPHGSALFQYVLEKGEKLGIINLDAHFDLRPFINGKGHSGSPFFQLAEKYHSEFHYLCLGIQRAGNPISLFETATKKGVNWIEMEDFYLENWEQIKNQLDSFCQNVNKIYLSIDLDGFSSAYAPGVSAPSPMGFSPEIAMKVLDFIARSGKLLSMDVVELNPDFDQDNSTARLAARCIEFIVRKMY